MKEHNVSQSIAPPTTIPIEIQPSADELMTDWLADRVNQAIDIVVNEAQAASVRLREISVFGFESPEEPTRTIFILPVFEASEAEAYDFWGVLADAFYRLNDQSPPSGAPNADVTVEVFIYR